MARSRNEYIKVRLTGKSLLAFVLYTAMMIGIGGALKSCQENQEQSRTKVTHVKVK